MDTATELAELKKEVATLKEQMADLKRFLHVNRSQETPDKPYLHIRCTSISLVDAKESTQPQRTFGGLAVSNGQPSLFLWGNDSTARVKLEVKGNRPVLTLFHDDLKPALVATIEKDTDAAFLAVFDHGKPRAVIKAGEEGGIISATNDEGLARVVMRAEGEHGEVSVLNSKDAVVGQLTSHSKQGGGALLIMTPEGNKAVTIANMSLSGLVAVHNVSGELIASMPKVSSPPGPSGERRN